MWGSWCAILLVSSRIRCECVRLFLGWGKVFDFDSTNSHFLFIQVKDSRGGEKLYLQSRSKFFQNIVLSFSFDRLVAVRMGDGKKRCWPCYVSRVIRDIVKKRWSVGSSAAFSLSLWYKSCILRRYRMLQNVVYCFAIPHSKDICYTRQVCLDLKLSLVLLLSGRIFLWYFGFPVVEKATLLTSICITLDVIESIHTKGNEWKIKDDIL